MFFLFKPTKTTLGRDHIVESNYLFLNKVIYVNMDSY